MKTSGDLISIIVPVYNVENYLNNCVQSLLNQTYKNIEIILVNDGSTDNCSKICDFLKRSDSRIKVIHKLNGGLSDARNVGIEIALGDYVMFVDSDDYIPNYAVEYLYNILMQNNADISIGRLIMTSELNSSSIVSGGKVITYNNCNAIGELLYANLFSTSAPAKLYNKKLFDGIRFPMGKLYEDLFTIYKVVNNAEKIVFGDEIVYFYYRRIGSITVSLFSLKKLDAIEALKQIKKDIDLKEYNIVNAYSSQLIENIFSYFLTDISIVEIKKYGLWDIIKQNRHRVLFDNHASFRIKGYILLSYSGLNITLRILRKYYSSKW